MPSDSCFVAITTDDARMPSFQTFEVLDQEAKSGALFIVRCLETKTNQYYSMIIKPNSVSPWMEMTDLIALDKKIICIVGSNDGSSTAADLKYDDIVSLPDHGLSKTVDGESFLAVADDGTTYYSPSTTENASNSTQPELPTQQTTP